MVRGWIFRWLANALALFLTSYIVAGIHINDFWAAVVAAGVLGIVNALVRPILYLLTLPATILTLGLFTFVVNAFMLVIVDWVTPGFAVDTFWSALLGAVLLSLFSAIFSALVRN